jgi:[ribosomal protein S5]-alanine N-acetyltransferase
MLMSNPVETERLLLRPESTEDSRSIHSMNSDPEVMRYIGNGQAWTSPLEPFHEQHRTALEGISKKFCGSLAVTLKSTGKFIGLCWLVPDPLLKEDLELGYRYVTSAWGHGYATEAGRVVVRLGLEQLALRRIVAAVHPDNPASRRVLEKLGFQYVRDVYHPRVGRNVPFYALERPNL